MQWIDVNMPWNAGYRRPSPEDIARNQQLKELLDIRERAVYGKTYEDLDTKGLGLEELDRALHLLDGIGDNLEDDGHSDAWLALVENKVTDPIALKFAKRWNLVQKSSVWRAIQPETLAFDTYYRQLEREHAAKQFCNHPMNRPGVLIEVLTPPAETPIRYLIGHINMDGRFNGGDAGLADDNAVIVLRYCVVWTADE